MSGPQQPAIRLYDALTTYGALVQAGAPPESYQFYLGWLDDLGQYVGIAARAGTLPIWHDASTPIIHPLFHIPQTPPHDRTAFHFDIGDAVGLLRSLTRQLPENSMERVFSDTISNGIITLLEGQELHPNPSQLVCLNQMDNGYYFRLAQAGNNDGLYWTSAQEAVNLFDDIIADGAVGDAFRFFAQSCKTNLTWRLDHVGDPRCGINILDTNPPAGGQMRTAGDYDGLYIPVYQSGLFAVIGQTADILQMNETAFALPIAGYNTAPNTTLTVFWGMQANVGTLLAHPLTEAELLERPNARFANCALPSAALVLPPPPANGGAPQP